MRSPTLPHGYHKPQPFGGRRLLTMSGVVIGGAIPAPGDSPRAPQEAGLAALSQEPVAQHRAGCIAANSDRFAADASLTRSLVARLLAAALSLRSERGSLFGVLVAIVIGVSLGCATYHLSSGPALHEPAVLIADAMRQSAAAAAVYEDTPELRRATGELLALFPLGIYAIHCITTRCAESAAIY